MATDLIKPSTQDHWDALRTLSWEYRDFLLSQPPDDRAAVTHAYPEDVYTTLMNGLEAEHSAPTGAAVLAMSASDVVGCGMARMHSEKDIEFKRIYVRPEAQGLGLGRAIVQNLIAQSRELGAQRVLLDTGRVLKEARALYLKMGFRERGPYSDVPDSIVSLLRFYEMDL